MLSQRITKLSSGTLKPQNGGKYEYPISKIPQWNTRVLRYPEAPSSEGMHGPRQHEGDSLSF